MRDSARRCCKGLKSREFCFSEGRKKSSIKSNAEVNLTFCFTLPYSVPAGPWCCKSLPNTVHWAVRLQPSMCLGMSTGTEALSAR